MSRRAMSKGYNPLLTAVLSLLACACGSHSSSPAAGQSGSGSTHRASAGATAADRDMVAAVSQAGSAPPIGLKFRLETRPVVGAPAELVLALIPTPGVDISHIHGSILPAEGLQLQSPRTFDIDAPQSGASLEQDVTVVPQRDGVLSFSASLEVDYDDTSIVRTFVIPLIAAEKAS
jgi:hypothetical protein